MAPRAISGSRAGHTPLLLHWSLTDGAGFAARQASLHLHRIEWRNPLTLFGHLHRGQEHLD
jgi:hypothetical protein